MHEDIFFKLLTEMKNKITSLFVGLILIASIPNIALAQDYYTSYSSFKPVSLGISFSPNISWMRYGDAEGFSSTAGLGFSYGLLADFAVAENYYFATGLLINNLWSDTSIGGAGLPNSNSPAGKVQYRLQYAEIPLAVKLKSAQRYHRSYYGKFGFSAGVKISGKQRVNDQSNRQNINDASVFRLGLQIGGGVEWQLDHNLRMMTGLTFNNGFTTTMKLAEPRNSYLSLDFGFFF